MQLKSWTGKVLFESAVETIQMLLIAAVASGADLCGANLEEAKFPAPTVVLLANWGEVSDQLCADLMIFDASCHPEPTKFDVWANGGECPYNGVQVERAAQFSEKKNLWNSKVGVVCRPYDLMVRLLTEKCPVWSEAQKSTFEATFKKAE